MLSYRARTASRVARAAMPGGMVRWSARVAAARPQAPTSEPKPGSSLFRDVWSKSSEHRLANFESVTGWPTPAHHQHPLAPARHRRPLHERGRTPPRHAAPGRWHDAHQIADTGVHMRAAQQGLEVVLDELDSERSDDAVAPGAVGMRRGGAAAQGSASDSGASAPDKFSAIPPELLGLSIAEQLERGVEPELVQLHLEREAMQRAVEDFDKFHSDMLNLGLGAQLRPAQRLVVGWFEPFTAAVMEEQRQIKAHAHGARDRSVYGPFLKELDPKTLAVITMHAVLSMGLRDIEGVYFIQLAKNVGTAVQAEFHLRHYMKHHRQAWQRFKERGTGDQVRKVRQMSKALSMQQNWDTALLVKVGAAMLHLFMGAASVVDESGKSVPALQHFLQSRNKKRYGMVRLHPKVVADARGVAGHMAEPVEAHAAEGAGAGMAASRSSLFESSEVEMAEMVEDEEDAVGEAAMAAALELQDGAADLDGASPAAAPTAASAFADADGDALQSPMSIITRGFLPSMPCHEPMVVPPEPWTAYNRGGYLTYSSLLLRIPPHSEHSRALRRTGSASMRPVFDALNAIASVPWRINAPVLEVVQRLWEEGGGVADLPPRTDMEAPPPPTDPTDAAAALEHKRLCAKVARENANRHSLRCDAVYKMQVAKKFCGVSEVYFPNNLDFRGRAYPMPPHLNHLGADLCRGLLTFSARRQLGPNGLFWLKVHLSNLCGVDKVPFSQRVQYVDDHLEQVLDSAQNPVEGRRWWMQADAPFQALAACVELDAALRSGCPDTYYSSLPVHMDGSCNGLQHYAALGRDVLGAQQVNVLPSDTPQDVYSGVLGLVREKLQADAAREPMDDSDRKTVALARTLAPLVNRKVVKQTVMTSVYGVTFVGARQQIKNRLQELARPGGPLESMTEAELYASSVYLARLTLNSLGRLFTSATEIMGWLGTVARLVALQGQPMSWITPLGLPVVQPYRRLNSMLVRTVVQSLMLAETNEAMPISASRQKSAFPPNYVHSLDSTHMLMTALDCTRNGLTFAAVHDSFWTHAGTVEPMNTSLRRQFHALHAQPLLEQLRDDLVRRFPSVAFPPLPTRGQLDLSRVTESKYFFA